MGFFRKIGRPPEPAEGYAQAVAAVTEFLLPGIYFDLQRSGDDTEQYHLRQMVFFQAAVVVGWVKDFDFLRSKKRNRNPP